MKTPGSVNPTIVYSIDDAAGNTGTELWGVTADGTTNKKIPVSVPSNLHFEFGSDIAAEVSTDDKTMVLSLENADESLTYLYKCNIDGSDVQPIPNVNGYIYLQTFINPTTVLYWKNADNGHNGELWQTNTDGSGNQKINISLQPNIAFGDGKFAKTTADGKSIIFSTFSSGVNQGNASQIFKCGIDGSGLKQITDANFSSTVESLVNNTAVLYHVFADTDQLWTINLDGTSNQQIALSLPTGLTLADSRAVVSNTSVFLVIEDANEAQSIYSANIDGSNVKLVKTIPAGYAAKLQGVIQ